MKATIRFVSVAGAYFLAAWFGFAFVFLPSNIAAFWPAAGLLLGYLLATPRRTWPISLAGSVVGCTLANLGGDRPISISVAFSVINAVEAFVGAVLTQGIRAQWEGQTPARLVNGSFRLQTVRDVLLVFIVPGIFVCSFAGLVAAVFESFSNDGGPFLDIVRTWWLADAVGIMTFLPIALTVAEFARRERRWPGWRLLGASVALMTGLLAVTWTTLASPVAHEHPLLSLPYPIFPLLLWGAATYGTAGSSLAIPLVSMIAVWGAANGYGPSVDAKIDPGDRTLVIQAFVAMLSLSTFVLSTALRERRVREADVRALNEELKRRVSEREIAVEELKSSEQRFRAIFETVFQFMGLLTTDGRILEGNRASLEGAAVRREDVLGKYFWETPWWAHSPELQERLRKAVEQAAGGETVRFEATHPVPGGRSGEVIYVDFSLTPCFDESGRVVLLVPEGHDITGLKNAENSLRKSQRDLRLALDNVGQGLWTWDIVNDTADVDDTWLSLYGYSRSEFTPGYEFWSERIHPDDRAHVREVLERHFANPDFPYDVEYRVRKKDGSWTWLNSRGKVFERDAAGRPLKMSGTEHDVSTRKQVARQLADSEALSRQFITHAPAAIAMFDAEMRHMITSERWVTDFRLEGRELIGKTLFETLPQLPDRWRDIAQRALAGAVERGEEEFFLSPNTPPEWLQWEARPWHNAAGDVGGVMIFVQSITLRKKSEEQTLASLREKEVLLREVHHRVKNNLAVIVSLLHLQSASVKDPQTLTLLREAQDRVRSMALVHEHLYQSTSLAEVDFTRYAEALSKQIFQTYQLPGGSIQLRLEVDAVTLNVEKAIPCGLILNELLSNSLKHGFHGLEMEGRPAGEVVLSLHADAGTVRLKVSDNGRGMPADLDIARAKSLGLRLVRLLSAQLGGQAHFTDNAPGTAVTIEFSTKDAE